MPTITELLSTPVGSIVISVLLGFGLAALFRKACQGNQCIIVKGPSIEDVSKFYYKIDEDCYKYTPVVVDECN